MTSAEPVSSNDEDATSMRECSTCGATCDVLVSVPLGAEIECENCETQRIADDEEDDWDCGSGRCDPNTGCPSCSDEDRPWVRRR